MADTPTAAAAGNPDPTRFVVLKAVAVGTHTVARVHYPDARNYEGVKVLVYRDVSPAELQAAGVLDPHFCDHGGHASPFARFEPTSAGWSAALTCAAAL
jgi:hypothetical protein